MTIEDDIGPVSLTSQMAKLMEGFTLARILLDVACELDPKQFAVAGKSTSHAIRYLLHLALEALDSRNCWVRFFFADFRKGFDLIDHIILLMKLKSLKLHSSLVRWLAAFILERSQCVRISDSSSPCLHLNGEFLKGRN